MRVLRTSLAATGPAPAWALAALCVAAYGAGATSYGLKLLAIAGVEMGDVDSLQYLELRDAETLEPMIGSVSRPAVLLAAAFIGSTRLIDNVIL